MGNVPIGQLEMDIGRPPELIKELIKRSNLRSEMWGAGKFLVFYRESAPHRVKTNWIMHEFRVFEPPKPPEELVSMIRGVYRKDERISERSRYESRVDESSSSSSKIPRLELSPNPNEADNPYEE
ncbi:hypothetical protein CK203_029593 [Vitis vinifera]|uniref:NAC domain-containing protein n=1 Tax=Vitis vinifera TaxID=29760 RepID=A0A438JCF8_VITVI|nr:hypothetical protein CK203_029593 [Vitis vinifera]